MFLSIKMSFITQQGFYFDNPLHRNVSLHAQEHLAKHLRWIVYEEVAMKWYHKTNTQTSFLPVRHNYSEMLRAQKKPQFPTHFCWASTESEIWENFLEQLFEI